MAEARKSARSTCSGSRDRHRGGPGSARFDSAHAELGTLIGEFDPGHCCRPVRQEIDAHSPEGTSFVDTNRRPERAAGVVRKRRKRPPLIVRRGGGNPDAYDVRLAWSKDGGHTWSAPTSPHHDGTKTEHGFASLFQAPGAGLGVVWLDGRTTCAASVPSARARTEGTSAELTNKLVLETTTRGSDHPAVERSASFSVARGPSRSIQLKIVRSPWTVSCGSALFAQAGEGSG